MSMAKPQDLAALLAQPLLAGDAVQTDLGTFLLAAGKPVFLPSSGLLAAALGEQGRRTAEDYASLLKRDVPDCHQGSTQMLAAKAFHVAGVGVALKLVGEAEVGNLGAFIVRVAYGEEGRSEQVVTFSPSEAFLRLLA